jgi:hypothetical protein
MIGPGTWLTAIIRSLDSLPSMTNAAVPNPSFRLPLLTARAVPEIMACAIYSPLSVTDSLDVVELIALFYLVKWSLKVVDGTLLGVLVRIRSMLMTVI